MRHLNICVIGAGMYVAGRGTGGYGTVVPAIAEWSKRHATGGIFIVGKSGGGIRKTRDKVSRLLRAMGVPLAVCYHARDGAPGPDGYEKIFAGIPRPACAIIAVPDRDHARVASAAIRAGLHALVVKPLVPTVTEARRLIGLQKKAGVYCAVEFHKRFDLANMKMRDAIAAGSIGDPLYFLVEYSQRKSIPLKAFRRWAETTNIFQYLGIHYVDIVYFATGAVPRRVMAVGQKNWLVSQGIDVCDAVESVIEWDLPSGKRFVSVIAVNWIDPESTSAMSDQKIKVIGTRGRFESDQKDRGITIVTDAKGIEEPNPYFCAPYGPSGAVGYHGYGIDSICRFLSDVVDVEEGRATVGGLEAGRPTFRQSVVPTAVLEAANRSLRRGGEWMPIKV